MFSMMSHRRQLLAAGLLLLGLGVAPAVFAPPALASGDPAAFVKDVSNQAITEIRRAHV